MTSNNKQPDLQERIAKINKIIERVRIIKALSAKFDKNGDTECPMCDGEGYVEVAAIAFETEFESIPAGIQDYYDHKAALEEIKKAAKNLVDAIEESNLIKSEDKIDKPTSEPSKEEPTVFNGVKCHQSKDGTITSFQMDATAGDVTINLPVITKSIWKPISELPVDGLYEVIIKIDSNVYRGFVEGHDDKSNRNLLYMNGAELNYRQHESTGQKVIVCLLKDFITHSESLEERIAKLESLTLNK